MTRVVRWLAAAGFGLGAMGVWPGLGPAITPARANPTAYNVAPLLQQRDAFADQFWGLLQGPVAPAQPPAAQGQLYDFRAILGQPDPFAQQFWGQPVVPPRPAAPAPAPTPPRPPTAVPTPVPGPQAQLTPAPAPPAAGLPAQAPVAVQVVPAPPRAAASPSPGPALGAAAPQPSRWYAAGALGAATLGEATNTGPGVANEHAYDVGTLLLAALGNQRNANLAFEAEVAYRRFGLSTVTPAGGAPVTATGTVTTLSLMANATWTQGFGWRFNPYLLGGAGLARHQMDDVMAAGVADVTGNDLVIAYQVGFGAAIPVTPRWALDASYRYFATLAPELKDAVGNTFETSVASHNFLVGARYRF